jgi:hypothetical protein
MIPPNSFVSSGSSPPVDDTDTPPLPPELVEALANLLAEAIVADIRQFPNLAELQPNHKPMVESRSGLNRRRRSGRPQAAAQSGAPRCP